MIGCATKSRDVIRSCRDFRPRQFFDVHLRLRSRDAEGVKAGSTLTSYAGQTWRTLLDTVSRGSDQKVDRKDLACFAGILASFAAGLAASWQCWGNPLVDSGRELNVPLRLVHGEMLYSDVNYFYGPFSPYLNALLYRALHPSLWVLWGRGIVSTVLILALSYWIARQIAGRFPATLACLAITWVCALKSQGNYMMAYAFGGLDGCTFVLATTVFLIVFLRRKSPAILFSAGILGALAILSKTELGGAAVGTGVVAAALAGYPRIRNIMVWLAVFLAPALGIPALVFSWFAARVGWRTLTVDSHLFFGHVPWQLLYYNGFRFGFAHPWHSLGLMIASMVRLIAFGGLLVSLSLLLEMRRPCIPQENGGTTRKPSWAVAALLISLAGIVVSGFGLSDLGPFMAMPFLLLVPVAAGLGAFVQAERCGIPAGQLQAGTMVIIAASALGSLTRIILRVSTGGALSSFLLPGSVVLFVYIWLVIFPLLLPDPATRRRATQLVSVALVTSVLITAVTLSVRYRRKFPYPLVSVRGCRGDPAGRNFAGILIRTAQSAARRDRYARFSGCYRRSARHREPSAIASTTYFHRQSSHPGICGNLIREGLQPASHVLDRTEL